MTLYSNHDGFYRRYFALWGIEPYVAPDHVSWETLRYSFFHGLRTGIALNAPIVLFTAAFILTTLALR